MGIGRTVGDALRFGRRIAETATREVTQATRQATAKAQEVTGQVSSAASERARDAFVDIRRTGEAVGDLANTARNRVGGAVRNVVAEGRDRAQDTAGAARNIASAALDRAEDTFEAGHALARRTMTTANATANDLGQTFNETMQRTGPALLRDAATAVQANPHVASVRTLLDDFNLGLQVDRLQPGSSASIATYAEGNIKTGAGKTRNSLEVRRSEEAGGGYTVSTSNELGLGLAAKLGLKAGGEASIGAEAFGTRGTTLEFHFATAEEAKRAVSIIQSNHTHTGLRVGLNALPLGLGVVASQVLRAPRADLASLNQHISALEFEVDTEVSGALELDLGVASGNLGSEKNQTTTARVELEGGRPQRMTFTRSLELNISGEASVGPNIPRVRGASVSSSTDVSIGGDRALKVALEQSIDLPEGFSSAGPMPNSVETVRLAMRLGALESREVRLTLTDSAQAKGTALDVNGTGSNEVKMEIRGNLHDIGGSGALRSLAQGRVRQALDQLNGKVHMSATVQPLRTFSRDIGLGVHAGVLGAEAGTVTERTTVGEARNLNTAELIRLYLTRR
ncbi:hypothetical protein HUW63_30360 [Myxococcus sp. AM001]|nr:hypothetical protein [Myxococcus sp. AM001]